MIKALPVVGVLVAAMISASSASGLIVREPVSYSYEFSGAACGDTDSVRISIPRKSSISSIRPKLGAALRDIETRLTTARMSAIRRFRDEGRLKVEFTATGSDDVCTNPDSYLAEGWKAWHTMTVNIRHRYSVFMSGADQRRPQRRPRIIYLGASQRVYDLHWTSWGKRVARGRGIFPANDCMPTCADGTVTPRPVNVRLTKPMLCGSRYRYLVLRYTFPGSPAHPPPVKFGYTCGLGPNSP